MKTLLTNFRKVCVLLILTAIMGIKANATTYTAILSGNFNASTTWVGGLIPGSLVSSDIIVIPSGITVNLTSSETISGTSTLTVNGALTSTAGTALIMTSGSLTGSGSITVDSVVLGLTSGFSFTGSIAAHQLTSLGATLSSAASVTVSKALYLNSGALSLSSANLTLGNHAWVNLSGGTVTTSGSGMIGLDSMYNVLYTSASATSGLELHGSGLDSVTINVPGTITLSGNDTINGRLTLTSGTLALNGHTLTISGTGDLSSMGSGTITGTAASNLVINTSGSLTGTLNFASGANMLNNLTINSGSGSGNVNLGGDLSINGVLNLNSGSLSLNNHTLTLNAGSSLSSSASGSLTGTSSSSLVINSAGSLTGALNFSTSGNMLNNLTLNMGSASDSVHLGTNLSLTGMLNLQTGKLTLGNNNLTINAGGMLMGGGSNSYVVTNGTGSLVMNLTAGNTDTFKVGTYANFSPISVTANSGSASGDVSVSTMAGVLSSGTTGTLLSSTRSLVNATWMVSSSAASGINYNLTAMWNAGMEVNGFNRAQSFISHFHGGVWDTTSASAAGTMGSLYTQTRTGLTSLSPFTVADRGTFTTAVPAVATANNEITLYPNPAVNTVYFSGNSNVEKVAVYDIFGKQVLSANGNSNGISVATLPAGTYMIHFTGNNVSTVRKFVKE